MRFMKRVVRRGVKSPRRSMAKVLLLAAVVALVASACAEEEAEDVVIRFSFDWKMDGDWAPLIWAGENGYFEEEGLNVEWMEGDGSSAVLPLLGAGELEIAQISAPPLVLSVPEGIPVTVVGVQGTGSPNVFLCDPSIQTPADLAGKRYADQVGEFEHALWIAWTAANNVNIADVDVVPATGESGDVLFIEGELDCYIDFWTSGVIPEVLGARDGEESLFFVRDSLDIYGQSMAVNNDFLDEHPDAVRGFLKAYARGVQYAVNNRDATLEKLIEEMPANDPDSLAWSIDRYIEQWNNELSRAEGILAFEARGFEATKTALVDADLMPDVDISGLYTFEYLPDPPITP